MDIHNRKIIIALFPLKYSVNRCKGTGKRLHKCRSKHVYAKDTIAVDISAASAEIVVAHLTPCDLGVNIEDFTVKYINPDDETNFPELAKMFINICKLFPDKPWAI